MPSQAMCTAHVYSKLELKCTQYNISCIAVESAYYDACRTQRIPVTMVYSVYRRTEYSRSYICLFSFYKLAFELF